MTTCQSDVKSLAFCLGEKIKNPDVVKTFVLDPQNANPFPLIPKSSWHDLSLACGFPTLVLFFSTLQRQCEIDCGKVLHQYILKIKESLEVHGISNLSLFGGLTGVCFAIQQASCEGTRYQKMLSSLHKILLDKIQSDYLIPIEDNLQRKERLEASQYDIISGITGIGIYTLSQSSDPAFFDITRNILKLLIQITTPLSIEGKSVPGWHVASNDALNVMYQDRFPKGNFNLGLAHGVPGILALLSISLRRGVVVPGQIEAIERIIFWIQEKSFLIDGQIRWPSVISWEEETNMIRPSQKGARDAWCYGAPGIARSLYLAGKALNSISLKQFSMKAFTDIFLRSFQDWGIPSPSFCHGVAGLLMITKEMAQEIEGQHLNIHKDKLLERLLSFYNPNSPFGFSDLEPSNQGGFVPLNKIDLLEGAVGAWLSLLSINSTSCEWHTPFLIHD